MSASMIEFSPQTLTPDDPSSPVFALLATLGIASRTITHPALRTVEESQALRGSIEGGHVKNLFVKDKAGRLFLITAEEESPLDLKQIDKIIGARGRVSFASAEQLLHHLGVTPGSVTPLALLNDRAGAVTFILEKKLLRHDWINVHPLINTRTTGLKTSDLLRYISATEHAVNVLDLPYRAIDAEGITPTAD
jgi:Ala-tRNA(Pro) deacylase